MNCPFCDVAEPMHAMTCHVMSVPPFARPYLIEKGGFIKQIKILREELDAANAALSREADDAKRYRLLRGARLISDTPEVDANEDCRPVNIKTVTAEFARQLERRLNEAVSKIPKPENGDLAVGDGFLWDGSKWRHYVVSEQNVVYLLKRLDDAVREVTRLSEWLNELGHPTQEKTIEVVESTKRK